MSRKKQQPEPEDNEALNIPTVTQQISDLQIGQSISFAERLDGDNATKEAIQAARKRLRNIVASPINRVRIRTGQTYLQEGGEITTRNLDVLVIVVVTRAS